MTSHRLALTAVDRAERALNHAASELTIAMLASPRARLSADVCVLAGAVEREGAAIEATLARESETTTTARTDINCQHSHPVGSKTRSTGARMTELLDRVRQELRARLEQSRAAVQEYEQLHQALAALDGDAATRARRATSTGAGSRRRGRPASARTSTRKRAPRGANREAVLHALGERPGASASELAAASGVQRATMYNLLRTLTSRGEITRVDLPSGSAGYRLTPAD